MGIDDLIRGYHINGLRQVMCVMTILSYNLIVCYVLSHQDGDLDFCGEILSQQLLVSQRIGQRSVLTNI